MQEIQLSLAAAVRACIRELRKTSSLVDISFLFGGDRGKKKRKRDDGDFATGAGKSSGRDISKQGKSRLNIAFRRTLICFSCDN